MLHVWGMGFAGYTNLMTPQGKKTLYKVKTIYFSLVLHGRISRLVSERMAERLWINIL
jgi:hypothetical protein